MTSPQHHAIDVDVDQPNDGTSLTVATFASRARADEARKALVSSPRRIPPSAIRLVSGEVDLALAEDLALLPAQRRVDRHVFGWLARGIVVGLLAGLVWQLFVAPADAGPQALAVGGVVGLGLGSLAALLTRPRESARPAALVARAIEHGRSVLSVRHLPRAGTAIADVVHEHSGRLLVVP
jgi:xanthosine utilization system XapX-like protein